MDLCAQFHFLFVSYCYWDFAILAIANMCMCASVCACVANGKDKVKLWNVQSGRSKHIFYLAIFIIHSNKSFDWISSTCNSHMNDALVCHFLIYTFFFSLAGVLFQCFSIQGIFSMAYAHEHTCRKHTHTKYNIPFLVWAAFRSIIGQICHNNGFSVQWVIFLLSSEGNRTNNSWYHRIPSENLYICGKNWTGRLSFSVLWFPLKSEPTR